MEIREGSVIINVDESLSKIGKDYVTYTAKVLDTIIKANNNNVYVMGTAALDTTVNFMLALAKEEDK